MMHFTEQAEDMFIVLEMTFFLRSISVSVSEGGYKN